MTQYITVYLRQYVPAPEQGVFRGEAVLEFDLMLHRHRLPDLSMGAILLTLQRRVPGLRWHTQLADRYLMLSLTDEPLPVLIAAIEAAVKTAAGELTSHPIGRVHVVIGDEMMQPEMCTVKEWGKVPVRIRTRPEVRRDITTDRESLAVSA